jgi:hypothetical protein
MDIDLRERFESSFVSEPPPRPTDDLVSAGRRALRRRRVVTSAAVGLAACAVGVVAAIQLGGHPSSGQQPIQRPQPETGARVEARLTREAPVDYTWRADCGHDAQPDCDAYALDAAPVSIRADGKLVRINAEVIIARRTVDPTPAPGTRRIEVEVRTPANIHSRWFVLTQDAQGKVTAEEATNFHVDWETWTSGVNRDVEVPGAGPLTPVRVLIGS